MQAIDKTLFLDFEQWKKLSDKQVQRWGPLLDEKYPAHYEVMPRDAVPNEALKPGSFMLHAPTLLVFRWSGTVWHLVGLSLPFVPYVTMHDEPGTLEQKGVRWYLLDRALAQPKPPEHPEAYCQIRVDKGWFEDRTAQDLEAAHQRVIRAVAIAFGDVAPDPVDRPASEAPPEPAPAPQAIAESAPPEEPPAPASEPR